MRWLLPVLILLPMAASVIVVSTAAELRDGFSNDDTTEIHLAADVYLGEEETILVSAARLLVGHGFGVYQNEGATSIMEVGKDGSLDLRNVTLSKIFAPTLAPSYAPTKTDGPSVIPYTPTAIPSREPSHVGQTRPPTPVPSTGAPTGRFDPHGGCLVLQSGSSLSARDVLFSGCTTDDGDGGGIAAYGAVLEVTNCSFESGRAPRGTGGAIYAMGAIVSIVSTRTASRSEGSTESRWGSWTAPQTESRWGSWTAPPTAGGTCWARPWACC